MRRFVVALAVAAAFAAPAARASDLPGDSAPGYCTACVFDRVPPPAHPHILGFFDGN